MIYLFLVRSDDFSTTPVDNTMIGLLVADVGDISLPVYERQAKDLIAKCEKAPFGRKDQTIRDDRVRDTWQLDSSQAC